MIYLNIRKYLEAFGLFLILIVLSSIIIASLSYFNVISSKLTDIIEIICLILATLISSIYLGKKSSQKGYLEGLKFSIIITLFLLLFNIGFTQSFNLIHIFFYLIIFIIPIIGAIVGINKKRG